MTIDPLMFARFYVVAESRVRDAVNAALGENAYESFQAALQQQVQMAQQQAQAAAQQEAQMAQQEAMEAQAKAQAKAQKQAGQPAMGEETAGSEYGNLPV